MISISTGLWAQEDEPIKVDTLDTKKEDFVTLSGLQLDDDSDAQLVSGLLHSSNDVFTNKATFGFRASRFNIRGLRSDHYTVMMNGVPMTDPELGFTLWSNWGGLNDITRRPETQTGISQNDFFFSGIGGYSNIDVKASTKRPGTRISQALTNRSYRHRTMVTHHTGVLKNGWSVSASGSLRWADEGYVPGTFYSAGSYYLSIEKKINDKSDFGVVGFGAPSVVGRAGISTQEAYDLKGDDFYNSYWGYQNGEKRNSRVRNSHKPTAMLWYENRLNEKSMLRASAFLQSGKYSQSRLNWYEGNDPRGDYYRYLPSYVINNQAEYEAAVDDWENNETTGQIDWDELFDVNRDNFVQVQNVGGDPANVVSGIRSQYIVEDNHIDPTMYGISLGFNHDLSEKTSLDFSINTNSYKSENYQVVKDLLGGDFWVNVNQFILRDYDEATAQNNVAEYNQIIKEGERFGYDYNLHMNKAEVFGQIENKGEKLDLYLGLTAGTSSFYRDGQIENALFGEESIGKSETSTFTYGGVKAGGVYKISGRHFIEGNVNYSTRPPRPRNSFISPRTRNQVADNLSNEKIMAYDLSYIIRHPKMKLRASWFAAAIDNQVRIMNVFLDGDIFAFGTLRMEDVDFLNTGIELGIERNLSQTWVASGALSVGEFIYNNRPKATFIIDSENTVEFEDRLIYMDGFKQGRMPQTVANLEIEYVSPKFWRAGLEYNMFYDVWLDPNPIRRTAEMLESVDGSDAAEIANVFDQQKLNNGGSLNFSASKSWKLKDKFLLAVLNVNNVLNDTDFITGFEQIRSTGMDDLSFAPRLGHMYGMSYFLMLRLDF